MRRRPPAQAPLPSANIRHKPFMLPPDAAEQRIAARREGLDLLRRRHGIFVGIYGKPIELGFGDPPGRTDCETQVVVPAEDEEVELIHKHEWQHLFMKSDPRARTLFVMGYLNQLAGKSAWMSRSNQTAKMKPLEDYLNLFINGLDDLRVNHLWQYPYPKSSRDIAERWRRLLRERESYRTDLISYAMALGLGMKEEMRPSEWDEHRALIEQNLSILWGSGPEAPMLAVRLILDHLFWELSAKLRQEAQEQMLLPAVVSEKFNTFRQQTLSDLANKRISAKAVNEHDDLIVFTAGNSADAERSEKLARAALHTDKTEDIQKVLEQGRAEMQKAVKALMKTANSLTQDERLVQGLGESVRLIDLYPRDVKPTQMQAGDWSLAEQMRRLFFALKEKKRRSLAASGGNVDVSAYVDMLAGSGNAEVFEDHEPRKGFSALVLLDMSGSMASPWHLVDRACRVLTRAMKNPFSQVEVWGFSGAESCVNLFRFRSADYGYTPKGDGRGIGAWGSTPLHIAVEAAVRHMKNVPGTMRHLFIISDGLPVFFNGSGNRGLSKSQMVGESVRQARAAGIRVSCAIIGDEVPDAKADIMFGKKAWERISDEQVFSKLVTLVATSFGSFLLHKRRR